MQGCTSPYSSLPGQATINCVLIVLMSRQGQDRPPCWSQHCFHLSAFVLCHIILHHISLSFYHILILLPHSPYHGLSYHLLVISSSTECFKKSQFVANLSSSWLIQPSSAELRLALILVITPTQSPKHSGPKTMSTLL